MSRINSHARLVAVALAAMLAQACGAASAPSPAQVQSSEVVRLWTAPPPDTQGWSGLEVEAEAELPGAGMVHIVTNVTAPTFTVFRPRPGTANGTAVLVLPGGAFRALAWDLEGTEVAQWLAQRGITAFVLKYRVRQPADGAASGAEAFDLWFGRTQPARMIAVADARQALRLIRADAADYGIAANRVGMIGFSAGAMTVMELATSPEASARPDFAAAIYGAMAAGRSPPAGAPPLFVVAAQDDPQVPPQRSLDIYEGWSRANIPAELHLYERGGHGFGMRAQNLPVGRWPEALERWLLARGLTPAVPAP